MIDNAQQALSKVIEKNAAILKWAENTQITNIEEQKRVEELSAELKYARKQAVEQMNNLLNPAKETVKNIIKLFNPYISNVDTLIKKADDALSFYRKELVEAPDKDFMARATEYHEKVKEAEGTGEIIPLPDLGVTVLAKSSHHNMGYTTYRTYIKVTVVKPSLVPREYCVPSETLLRKAGEIALAQKEPMPIVEGAIIEVKYTPVSRGI